VVALNEYVCATSSFFVISCHTLQYRYTLEELHAMSSGLEYSSGLSRFLASAFKNVRQDVDSDDEGERRVAKRLRMDDSALEDNFNSLQLNIANPSSIAQSKFLFLSCT